MSADAEFIFKVPSQYQNPENFVAILKKRIGLDLSPVEGEKDLWAGRFVGMDLYFHAFHGIDEDDRDIPYSHYPTSLSLTGYANWGGLRVTILSAVINLGMAICYLHETDGVVLFNRGKIVHIGFKAPEVCVRDLDRNILIQNYSDLSIYLEQGVTYKQDK